MVILSCFIYIYIKHEHNSSFWSSNLIGWWECDIRVQQNSNNRFIVCNCISLLAEIAVFLTASVMADTQIHYHFKNNTVFVSWNVVLRVFRQECTCLDLKKCGLLIKITSIWKFAISHVYESDFAHIYIYIYIYKMYTNMMVWYISQFWRHGSVWFRYSRRKKLNRFFFI